MPASCAAVLLCAASAAAASQPHIALIVADDLGWNDVSWHNADVKSPYLAQLAADGVKLGDYHVYKVCSPSRASFMTGRYPNRAGLHGFIAHNKPDAVSANFTFLPEVLSAAGYATHMVGKWHLGYWDWRYLPTGRGYDSFFGYMGGAEDYYKHTHAGCSEQPKGPGYPMLDLAITFPNKTLVSQPQYMGTYALDFFVPYIQDIIAAHPKTKPLFLYLPFQNVHEPLQVPANWTEQYAPLKGELPGSRITLMGMVSALDKAVEGVVGALQRGGLWSDTLLVFTTDNGGNLDSAGNNYPLRGGKFTFWEGGTRGVGFVHSASAALVPAAVRGGTYAGLFHAADWLATLCDAAGAAPPRTAIDSVSQWGALRGGGSPAPPRTEIVHETQLDGKGALKAGKLRSGKWNLYVGSVGKDELNGWRHPNGTQEPGAPTACPCLFDVAADPTEHTDVAAQNPGVVAELRARLLAAAACPDAWCDVDKYTGAATACDAFDVYGTYGPWADAAPAPPPAPTPAPPPAPPVAGVEYRHGSGCLGLGDGGGEKYALAVVPCASAARWEEGDDARGAPQILTRTAGAHTCLNVFDAKCRAGAEVHAGPCQDSTTKDRKANHFHWDAAAAAIASDYCAGFCVDATSAGVGLAPCGNVTGWSRVRP